MINFDNVTIVNTETTGLDFKQDQVIALCVGYKSSTGKWDNMTSYCKADVPITPEISYLHDITESMLGDKRLHELDGVIPDVNEYVVMCNSTFHAGMINGNGSKMLSGKKLICVSRISKKLDALGLGMTNYKLPYLNHFFGANIKRNDYETDTAMHNAIIGKVFEKQVEMMKALGQIHEYNLEEIYEWLEAPIIYENMTFGKHVGKPMVEIPITYWTWALSNMDSLQEDGDKYDSDLAASVAAALDKIL